MGESARNLTQADVFATIAQPLSVANVLLNIFLVILIRLKSGKEMTFYKQILTIQTLLALIFALLQSVSLPFWFSASGVFLLIPTGLLRDSELGAWVMLVLCAICGELNVMLATTFFFNYVNICKRTLCWIFRKKWTLFFIVCIHIVIFFAWFLIVVIFCGNSDLVYNVAKPYAILKGIQLHQGVFMGFAVSSTKNTAFLYGLIAGMLALLFIFSICFALMVYCGVKIVETLRKNTVSKKLRQMHTKIFTMVVVQAACPLFFLQTPSFFNIICTATGIEQPSFLPLPLALLLQFYSTSHVVVTVYYIREYKEALFPCIVRILQNSRFSQVVSITSTTAHGKLPASDDTTPSN